MARRRKTFDVDKFKNQVNHYLLHTHDDKREGRRANASLLEIVLMDSGNYRGFGYLNAKAMKLSDLGNSVGINTTDDKPAEKLTYEERFENTDESRRHYF